MENKVYVIYESHARNDGDDNREAECFIYGVYTSLDAAKKALTDCKNKVYEEVLEYPCFEDLEDIDVNITVCGSEEQDYYSVQYVSFDDQWDEILIGIEEKVCK